ncbi:MAG: DUF5126 domain-containing protein [Bacteroidales bacterium]|nr:DUF5126 domain-containing protein [Bacteroidales bacterium]
MKKSILLLSFYSLLMLSSCDDGSNFGRIDQLAEVGKPDPVEIVSVTPTSGGAIIKVNIPDDDRIKGVVARYERNGEEVNYKCSRYVDSLVVEGFSDTNSHIVRVASFNVNEELSTDRLVDVRPLTPVIQTVKAKIFEAFGGVKVNIQGNESKSNLAVCLLRCADLADSSKAVKDIKWVEVTTLFTESNDINLVRRGIEAEKAIFGVYIRDNWGNITDTVKTVLTPILEEQIYKSLFSYPKLADDNHFETSLYPVASLWDGSGSSQPANPYHFFASDKSQGTPIPGWITINLGQVVSLSRIQTLPRIEYEIWSGGHPREFEFWGSMNPTGKEGENEHGFDDTWFCLGKFEQFKPSGYNADGSVGTPTKEDNAYFNSGNDFELDPNQYPHCYDELRYLRVVVANTFTTYETGSKSGQIQLGEVTPWGQNQKH